MCGKMYCGRGKIEKLSGVHCETAVEAFSFGKP